MRPSDYARLGYYVLPLHTTKNGACSCGGAHEKDNSAGKHPVPTYAPGGLSNATNDLDEIEQWPSWCNIGLATGRGLVVLDIDDQAIAEAALGLEGETVVQTGRGAHVYIRTTEGEFRTIVLRTDEHIGELRGDGAYVVAPPSRHKEGQYRFVHGSIEDVRSVDDALAWARSILRRLGVELPEKVRQVDIADVPSEIADLDIPNETTFIRQLREGTYPTSNRSAALYRLGCEIWRENEGLTEAEVAGMVKKVDAVAYRKFTGRSDSLLRYWEIAVRSKDDVADDGRRYTWDGRSFSEQRSGKTVELANFEPRILEEVVALDDLDGNGDILWKVQCTRGREVYTFELSASQTSDLRQLKKAFFSALPASFIVQPNAWQSIVTAMQSYCVGKIPRRRVYRFTGWIDEETFLTPTGPVIGEATYEGEPLGGYGVGMVRVGEDKTVALGTLLQVAEPHIIVPLVSTVLCAGLTSLLEDRPHHRFVLHLFGRTQSYKTSLARCVLSMWGDFVRTGRLLSWSSTINALEQALYVARDLPVVIDDYKVSVVRHDAVRLLQNYADETGRSRMAWDRGSTRIHKALRARGLLITTGEDVWEGHESLLARTVVLRLTRDSVDLHRLAWLQQHSWLLSGVGTEWVEWLAENREAIVGGHDKAFSHYQSATIATGRMRDNLAQLKAWGAVVGRFLRERYPGIGWRELEDSAWETLSEMADEQAMEQNQMDPLSQVIDAVVEAVNSDAACIASRWENGVGIGIQGLPVVAWYDDEHLYISRETTFSWYKKRLKQEGETLRFSWNAVVNEASEGYGSEPIPRRIRGGLFRALNLPLNLVTQNLADFPDVTEKGDDVTQ